jgi:hypothetical protein
MNGATLSECGNFRYRLWRIWAPEAPHVLWVMLNPSTADATVDDPTIRKCIAFAKRWECGGIEVVNLYAFRATDPADLKACQYRVGPRNFETLRAMLANHAGPVVAAWGAHAQASVAEWFRVEALLAGKPLYRLRRNKDGTPGHPLYIPLAAELVEWPL